MRLRLLIRRRSSISGRSVAGLLLALCLASCAESPPVPAGAGAALPPNAAGQSVRLAPTPADARCEVRQGQDAFAAVAADGTVELQRAVPVDIVCRKSGFRTLRVRKVPTFDFGAPAGRQMAYPDVVDVELQPDGPR